MGKNTRIKTSANAPLTLFAKDFDNNGAIDPILSFYHQGKLYPYAGRDNLAAQMPVVKQKYPRYTPYAHAAVEAVFTAQALQDAQKREAYILESTIFINENGRFVQRSLPPEAQIAPVEDILLFDINQDGNIDILTVGNFNGADTETGVYDASNGCVFLGDGKGNFSFIPNREHGFWASGEARCVELITLANGNKAVIVGNNDGDVEVYGRMD